MTHERVAATGPETPGAMLRLAARPGIGLNPQVRTMVAALTREGRASEAADGWLLRLAADWARDIPLVGRDEDWIRTVEMLLAAVVRAEHAAGQEIRAAAEVGEMSDSEAEERIARLSSGWLPACHTASCGPHPGTSGLADATRAPVEERQYIPRFTAP